MHFFSETVCLVHICPAYKLSLKALRFQGHRQNTFVCLIVYLRPLLGENVLKNCTRKERSVRKNNILRRILLLSTTE